LKRILVSSLVAASCLVVGMLAPTPPASAAAAVGVPTASCVDGNFFDGLDTRYAATYCRNALTAAGYSATAYTNTDATSVLEQVGTDGIYYHAGHALVDCQTATYCTAVASAFAGASSSATTYTGLLGDPNGVEIEGPGTVCSAGGGCRSVDFVNYPYETQMQKFNLAVFQSCNSALDGADGFTSLATEAYDLGVVGTAIGFRDEVSWITNAPGDNLAGDAFARRFWSDLQSGRTYDSALVDAANAGGGSTYGYSSYVYLHDPAAPSTLRPAQYFAPGAGGIG
jgi:hypothetical protein